MTDLSRAATLPTTAIARPALVAGAAAGACGLAFALSPLGTLALTLTLWLCYSTASTLERGESWFWWLAGGAIGLRFVTVAAMFVLAPYSGRNVLTLAPDAEYLIDRAAILRNMAAGIPVGPHQYREMFNSYGASSYVDVLAVIERLLGPSPYALALVSTFCYVAAVLLLFHEVRRRFGMPPARVALGLLLFWPTLFVWSVSVLKESAQLLLLTISLVGALRAAESTPWRTRFVWAAGAAAALAALQSLRAGSVPIALGGLLLAGAAAVLSRRRLLLAVVVAAAVLGAWRFEDRIVDQVRAAATRHYGNVMSAGVSYRLLDQRFYSGGYPAIARMNAADSARYLANAAVMFVAAPVPSKVTSLSSAALAPQQLAWYLVVAAALLGARLCLARDRALTLLLAGYAVAGLIVIAPNSGNVGTLVRHRDSIVPFVLVLATPALAATARLIRFRVDS